MVNPGLSTVIGALVGGGASLGGTVLTQRWQRTRENEAREAAAREQALVAARIVLGDLAWARDRVKQALRNKRYWSRRYELISASWEQYRETLALCLPSTADWWTVHDAFRAIRTLQLHASKSRDNKEQSRAALTEWGTRQADQKLERIRAAIKVLEPIAGKRIEEEAAIDER